jgi:hypothetical protein
LLTGEADAAAIDAFNTPASHDGKCPRSAGPGFSLVGRCQTFFARDGCARTRFAGNMRDVNPTHPLIEFRPSAIQGLGGFAKVPIPAGTRVMEYVGERITKAQSLERCAQGNHAIFNLNENWDLDGAVDWNPARFLNHSCAPNCDAEDIEGRIWIVAQRAIEAGEEVTFNYGYDLEDYKENPCRCGATACVGYVVAEEFFDLLRAQADACRA